MLKFCKDLTTVVLVISSMRQRRFNMPMSRNRSMFRALCNSGPSNTCAVVLHAHDLWGVRIKAATLDRKLHHNERKQPVPQQVRETHSCNEHIIVCIFTEGSRAHELINCGPQCGSASKQQKPAPNAHGYQHRPARRNDGRA